MRLAGIVKKSIRSPIVITSLFFIQNYISSYRELTDGLFFVLMISIRVAIQGVESEMMRSEKEMFNFMLKLGILEDRSGTIRFWPIDIYDETGPN
jgi:hypothetical protein